MKISLIAAALPPRLDGIGDYTANLARELATLPSVTVEILTGQRDAIGIEGVSIESAFSTECLSSITGLKERLTKGRADWALLQYNPFWYGRWGWNPYLPLMWRSLRQKSSGIRLAVMVHEPFMPAISAKAALMSLYQRWQFWTVGRASEVIFFSIEAWAKRFRKWFPAKWVEHLPVSSNIPLHLISRAAARAHLGICDGVVVLGLFGTASGGRMLGHIKAALEAITRSGRKSCLVYVGPDGAQLQHYLEPMQILDCGSLNPKEVSRVFASFDIYLAPFIDGISTRRTNVMTALQHGRAMVGTHGPLTDSMLARENERAFLLCQAGSATEFAEAVLQLANKSALRESLEGEASTLFDREFTWPGIAIRLKGALERAKPIKSSH